MSESSEDIPLAQKVRSKEGMHVSTRFLRSADVGDADASAVDGMCRRIGNEPMQHGQRCSCQGTPRDRLSHGSTHPLPSCSLSVDCRDCK
jgi:hypothetical protein